MEASGGAHFSRLSLQKTFRGGLEGTSRGEMLSVRTPIEGSAGYVALEQVSGTLAGRTGTFVLQHFGVTHGGENRLVLEVLPNSGTDQLAGLSGTMTLAAADGRHTYALEYDLG